MNVYETENINIKSRLQKKKLLHFHMPDLIFNNKWLSVLYKSISFCFVFPGYILESFFDVGVKHCH